MYSPFVHRGSDQNPATPWVEGMVEKMCDQACNGWQLYYVNFMFEPLTGAMPDRIEFMKTAITKYYNVISNRFVRDTRSPSHQHKIPQFWLFPDRPGAKRHTQTLIEIKFNAGLHYNGIAAFPLLSRYDGDREELMQKYAWVFQKRGGSRIDVKPVTGGLERLSDYATKTIGAWMASPDDILVLPRALGELPRKPRPMDERTRRIKQIQSELNVSDEVAERMIEKQAADN